MVIYKLYYVLSCELLKDEWVILDDCEKVDKHEAELRRLASVRDETVRLRQEEAKRFVDDGVMKLPHMKLCLNRPGPKKREYKFVLRPPFTGELPKHVIPTLETLKSQKTIRDPFMRELCRDVKPWTEVPPNALYIMLVYYVLFSSTIYYDNLM